MPMIFTQSSTRMDFHNNGQSVNEVMRVSEAMPDLRLPFTAANPAPTLMALDRAVFEGRYSDSTTDLVDADVADGNRGFLGDLLCMEM